VSEPLTSLLAELPAARLSTARAERIKMRCRARLARQPPRASASRAAAPGGRMVPWQPLILVLAVVYLTEAIVQVLRVYSFP
jgi:hypothetical protein